MKGPLLILTAGYGEGHNAAARALVAAAENDHGPGAAKLVDVFALASPFAHRCSRSLYRQLIERAPGLWRRTYRWVDRSSRFDGIGRLLRREHQVLAQLLTQLSPAAICSTYPLYGCMLAALLPAVLRGCRHSMVVTDSITINSLWWRGRADAWYVPNEDSAAVLRERGLPPDRIRVFGFPVAPAFATVLEPRQELVAGARPRVLCLLNSATPAGIAMGRELLQREEWDVTCTVSNNERVRATLAEVASRRQAPGRVLGWTDQIPRLLQTHHVVVGKAGGATTQEALAAECPMIVNQIIPGQEEGNFELLRRHGIGGLASSPPELIALLQRAFADRGKLWREWHLAASRLARPDAAGRIVHDVLGFAALAATGRAS